MWDLWMRPWPWRPSLRATQYNPLVRAVVLDRDGRLVGEGFHARAGDAHAEVGALRQAGDAASGGTLVVTLEPCARPHAPCSEAVLRAGIRRVVIALEDPDPRVDGGGIRRLREAGLEVIGGVLREEAASRTGPSSIASAPAAPSGF